MAKFTGITFEEKIWLSVGEARQVMPCTAATMRRLGFDGTIRMTTLPTSGHRRYHKNDLLAYVAAGGWKGERIRKQKATWDKKKAAGDMAQQLLTPREATLRALEIRWQDHVPKHPKQKLPESGPA